MKKLLTFAIAAVVTVAFGVEISAQTIGTSRVGITAGFTSSSANVSEFDASSVSQFHAGLVYQIPLALGFSIQPGILYHIKGASLDNAKGSSVSDYAKTFDTKVGYLEVPVQVQWGPDLLFFRPYLLAEPFVGLGISTKNKATYTSSTLESKSFSDSGLKKLEYGLSLGGGIEFSRFQVALKYYWNFGSLYDGNGKVTGVGQTVKDAFDNEKNFNGFMASLALFF